jgi:hypothetical protein
MSNESECTIGDLRKQTLALHTEVAGVTPGVLAVLLQ